MHLPEDEVEDAVARIKERKMGRLFENVTMDIQAERRNTAQARAERDLARRERDIYKHILRMTARRCPDTEILNSLMQVFELSEKQAAEQLRQALED